MTPGSSRTMTTARRWRRWRWNIRGVWNDFEMWGDLWIDPIVQLVDNQKQKSDQFRWGQLTQILTARQSIHVRPGERCQLNTQNVCCHVTEKAEMTDWNARQLNRPWAKCRNHMRSKSHEIFKSRIWMSPWSKMFWGKHIVKSLQTWLNEHSKPLLGRSTSGVACLTPS